MANKFTCQAGVDGKVLINGELTQHSIVGKQQKLFKSIITAKQHDIDLSTVNKIDTAGLAWLIALHEFAVTKQSNLTYSQAPLELVKLAKLSQVDDLLILA